MLGKNDILVTNHKDKQEQIPKILAVNEEVKRTFSKGGHAEAAHQLMPCRCPRHLALPHGAYVFSHDMTWHADVDPWTHQIIEFRSFLRALTNKKQDHERKGRHREPRGSPVIASPPPFMKLITVAQPPI